MEKIHYIYIIFKNLLLLGNETIDQILLDDECYLITFGALEYEIETQEKISNHRDFFLKKAKFKNPLNITDKQILELYNESAAIARDGTTFAREFVEVTL